MNEFEIMIKFQLDYRTPSSNDRVIIKSAYEEVSEESVLERIKSLPKNTERHKFVFFNFQNVASTMELGMIHLSKSGGNIPSHQDLANNQTVLVAGNLGFTFTSEGNLQKIQIDNESDYYCSTMSGLDIIKEMLGRFSFAKNVKIKKVDLHSAHCPSAKNISPVFSSIEPIYFDLTNTLEKSDISLTDAEGAKSMLTQVSPRGHSSLEECQDFKLKVRLLFSDQTEKTPFDSLETMKIGTHCSTEDFGRVKAIHTLKMLGNEKSTHREAFLYQILKILDFPAPLARPAKINYRMAKGGTVENYTHEAFIFETLGAVEKRTGFKEKGEGCDSSNVDQLSVAKTYLFEALIGNWDWGIGKMRNVQLLETSSGSCIVIPEDFDRATAVNGRIPDDTSPEISTDLAEDNLYRLHINKHLSKALEEPRLEEAIQIFLAKKNDIYSELDRFHMDEFGKKNMKKHLEIFYELIEQ